MKKRKLLAGLLFAAAITGSSSVFAQVKIGTDPTNIDGSAILHLESSSKGFLPPRVALTSLTDATTVANPATGLIVFNTNAGLPTGEGIYVNTGTSASPEWGKLESITSTSGGTVKKLKAIGNPDPTKTITAGIFEFRLNVNGNFTAIQARLLNAPTQNITVSGRRLMWGLGDAGTFGYGPVTWTPTDYGTWKTIDSIGTPNSHMYYLEVPGQDQFYRLSLYYRQGAYSALLVEVY